jgi:hypothetical protein
LHQPKFVVYLWPGLVFIVNAPSAIPRLILSREEGGVSFRVSALSPPFPQWIRIITKKIFVLPLAKKIIRF